MAKKGETKKTGQTVTDPEQKDFAGSGVEGQKSEPSPAEKTVIRGEDVLKSMRERGVKI